MNTLTKTPDYWSLVGERFDERLPRCTAIFLKPDDDSLIFAYPGRAGVPCYYVDMRARSTYEEDPAFKLELCPYVFGGVGGGRYGMLMSHYYERRIYYPSLVESRLIFANPGLEATETFARAVDGGFSWRFDFTSQCLRYLFDRILYVVVAATRSCDRVQAQADKGLFTLSSGGRAAIIATPHPLRSREISGAYSFAHKTALAGVQLADWGLYDTVDDYLADVNLGKLSRARSGRKYLVLGFRVKLEPGQTGRLQLGVAFSRPALARASQRIRDLKRPVQKRWNAWFKSLPAVPFEDQAERQAYYKCWWVVNNNYYRNPQIGPSVLEAFPVYRGYWLWGLTAYEWNSLQNTGFSASFIRKVLDLFLDNQRADGYLAHAIYLDDKKPGERWAKKDITQTPHIPWICLRYHYITRDRQSLEKWWPGLVRFYEYLNRSRDPERLHLWSIITSYDTGLDTTSVFDKVTYPKNGKQQETYCYPAIYGAERARYEQAMARLAAVTGLDSEAAWLARAEQTGKALNRYLWDAGKKWYGVRHQNGELDTRVGVDGLFPFCYGLVPLARARQAQRSFTRLLGPYGVYSVAPGEKDFYAETYWRGPTWPKTCSCAMTAALRYFPEHLPRVKAAMVAMLRAHPSVWECLSALTGKVARGDLGFMCSPMVSSNVGAGEAVGAFFTAHGLDAFSIEESLPLVPLRNFHWAGFRLDIVPRGTGARIAVRAAEHKAGELMLRHKSRLVRLMVRAGRSYRLK